MPEQILLITFIIALIFSEVAIFGVAFTGFLIFFISEHAALHSRRRTATETGQHIDSVAASNGIFVIHFSILSLLSLLIAYNLRFFGADRTMEVHHRYLFNRYGRYFLSIMPLTGWSLSVLFPERQSEAAVLLAFIAGAVLFNVIKDEVPGAESGEPKFFIAGALIYAAVLLLLLWMER